MKSFSNFGFVSPSFYRRSGHDSRKGKVRMTQMVLRKFTSADRSVFLEMCEDFYSSGAALEPIPVRQMEETFEKAVAGSPYVMGFIMEAEGKTAGYGIVYPFYSNEAGGLCLMLEEIYVKPEFRSHRLGSQYLERIAQTVSSDVIGLKLEICISNEGARRLYEKHGFEPLRYGIMVKKL